MKIQVYSQELTGEVKITRKGSFAGVSFVLASHPRLHNEPGDDDRSMVTFWVASDGRTMDRHQYARVLRRAADLLDSMTPGVIDAQQQPDRAAAADGLSVDRGEGPG